MMLFAASMTQGAYSIEFGGNTTTSLSLSDDGVSISFPLSTGISFNAGLNLTPESFIRGGLSLAWYESEIFDLEAEKVSGPLITNIIFPSELYYRFTPAYENTEWFKGLKAGRFQHADPAMHILNQPLDGVSIYAEAGDITIGLGSAYTGLIWKQESGVLMSNLDLYYSIQDDTVLAAPRLLIYALTETVTEKAGAFSLYLLYQKDMRALYSTEFLITEGDGLETAHLGGLIDTFHIELLNSGGIGSRLGYTLFGIFETGRIMSYGTSEVYPDSYAYAPITAFAGGLNLSFSAPELLFSLFQADFVYSSGDRDKSGVQEGNTSGTDTSYFPVSTVTVSDVLSLLLGNTWYIDLGWISAPFLDSPSFIMQNLSFRLLAKSLFRSSVAPISAYGVDSASLSPYLGTEASINLTWQLLSDLTAAMAVSAFAPGYAPDGAFSSELSENPVLWGGSLALTVSF